MSYGDYNEKVANGVKKTSYAFVLRVLIRLGEAFPQKKFEVVSKPEMVSFINNLKPEKHVLPQRHGGFIEFEARPFSESTLWQYKAAVKTFYRWLFGVENTSFLEMPCSARESLSPFRPKTVKTTNKQPFFNGKISLLSIFIKTPSKIIAN